MQAAALLLITAASTGWLWPPGTSNHRPLCQKLLRPRTDYVLKAGCQICNTQVLTVNGEQMVIAGPGYNYRKNFGYPWNASRPLWETFGPQQPPMPLYDMEMEEIVVPEQEPGGTEEIPWPQAGTPPPRQNLQANRSAPALRR